MFRSENGGLSWEPVELALPWFDDWTVKALQELRRLRVPESLSTGLIDRRTRMRANPKSIALSPFYEADHTLYVSTRYRGMYRSTDAGRSVEKIDSDLSELWPMAAGARSGGRAADLFATARDQGVFRSTDGGRRWDSVNQGLDFMAQWRRQDVDERTRVDRGRSPYYDLQLAVSPKYPIEHTLLLAGGPGLY